MSTKIEPQSPHYYKVCYGTDFIIINGDELAKLMVDMATGGSFTVFREGIINDPANRVGIIKPHYHRHEKVQRLDEGRPLSAEDMKCIPRGDIKAGLFQLRFISEQVALKMRSGAYRELLDQEYTSLQNQMTEEFNRTFLPKKV